MEEALASLSGEKDHPFTPVRPALARPVEYVIISVGIILCVLLFLLYGRLGELTAGQGDIKQVQREGKTRTFVSRAIQCDLIKSIGAQEPKECATKEVQPYRDANIVPGTTSSRRSAELTRVVCAMLRQDSNVVVPDDLCPR